MPAPRTSVPLLAACLALSVGVHGLGGVVAIGAGRLGARRGGLPALEGRTEAANATGDTFEIPVEELNADHTGAATTAAPAGQSEQEAVAHVSVEVDGEPVVKAQAHPRGRARAAAPTASPEGATEESTGATALFGAVGERAAAPLAATFTRGFPQAASADPSWLSAPLGSAGTVDVELTIDEGGHLTGTRTIGTAGPALTEGIRRTLALVRARSFVAHGSATRLRISATVTADAVHDGLHGEVFAIGGSFEGGEGSGFFALAVGRRIDVRVREVR